MIINSNDNQNQLHSQSDIITIIIIRSFYYMTEFASGQYEANPAFWLATQGGMMGPSCPLATSQVGTATKSSLLGHITKFLIYPACPAKMDEYRPRSFLGFYWHRRRTQKRTWPLSSHFDLLLGQKRICSFTILTKLTCLSWYIYQAN